MFFFFFWAAGGFGNRSKSSISSMDINSPKGSGLRNVWVHRRGSPFLSGRRAESVSFYFYFFWLAWLAHGRGFACFNFRTWNSVELCTIGGRGREKGAHELRCGGGEDASDGATPRRAKDLVQAVFAKDARAPLDLVRSRRLTRPRFSRPLKPLKTDFSCNPYFLPLFIFFFF